MRNDRRDGRALLALAGLTAAVYLAAALLIVLVFASGASGAEPKAGDVVSLWNRLCAAEEARIWALTALNDSLHGRHPDRVTDARRLELYTQAILESERQAALLRAMRRAEFGKAGEDKGAKGVSLSGHPPGTVHVPERALGWRISQSRQICPECDEKMDGS